MEEGDGQLVGDKDSAQFATVRAKTRVNELLALQAEVFDFEPFMIPNI